ncbi:MAG: type II and III secretion system protein, partial [Phycisphaerae bacterium]|nr:type II and III secretion system protein [Phycisphaerae bacterium]
LAFGVDISVIADVSGANPIDALSGTISDIVGVDGDRGFAGRSLVGGATGGANADGVKIGFSAGGVAAFVQALDKVTDTVVLANPKIMTLNRQRAEILVGEKVAYLSTTTNQTSTTQTVEFLDTGTKLTLRPFVSQENGKYVVRLELSPSISSAELRDAGDVILPDEATQELTTNVMVPEGQTVVLGGLFEEETTITRKQAPGLANLPLIGEAFKGQDDTVTRTETIFLVTPHVVKDRALSVAGAAINEGVEMTRIGTREKLLPWSRTKLSAAHVRDALRAMEKGDKSRAAWEAGLALDLDPRMAEARRLKEKLAGHRLYWPNNGLLDSMVDNMVRKQTGVDRKSSEPTKPDNAPSREALEGIGSKASTDESVAVETTDETTDEATGEPGTETVETGTDVPAEGQPETGDAAEQAPAVDPKALDALDETELSIGVGESSAPVKLEPTEAEQKKAAAAKAALTGATKSQQKEAEENLIREFLGK